MKFVANPAFESELRRDPENERPVKDAAEDTAVAANRRIREMYRTSVMTPFMPAGGYRRQYGRKPVKVHRDQDGDIYVANHDHGAAGYEWGGYYTTKGRRLGPVAPLRVSARRNARLVGGDGF